METSYQSEPTGALTPASGMPDVASRVDWATRHASALQATSVPAVQSGAGDGAATVLIVDDSHTIRHLYSFVLQAAGYTVLAAVDGVDGLEMALRTRPSLLLVDMLMPRMDGVEMLRALRVAERERGLPQAPALLLTALATPPEAGPELGVLAVLDKGHLTPSDMAEEVRMFLAARAHA